MADPTQIEPANKSSVKMRLVDMLDKIVTKYSSVRSSVTMLLTVTLCYTVVQSFNMMGSVSVDKDMVTLYKEIFLYILGVFSGAVGSTITGYFSRNDRNGKIPGPDEVAPIETEPTK